MNKHDRKFGGRLLDIVLITTIVTLTAFIIIFTTASDGHKFHNVSASNQTGNQTEPAKSLIPDISSSVTQEIVNTNISGIQIINETLKDPSQPYTIQYIKTNFEAVNAEIKKYISDSKLQYENIIRLKNTVDQSDITTNLLNNLSIAVEMYPHQEQYISLVFTKNVAIRSNDPDTTVYTLLFNKETGEMVDLEQILNANEENLASLSEKIRQSIFDNPSYRDYLHKETLAKVTEPNWIYFRRFSIKNNSLVFYFNKGEIANNSIGVPTATVSLQSINPLLATEFQTGLKGNSIFPNPPSKENSTEKKVALTFDDGPHPTITPLILDTLDEYDAKATFFVVGNRVEKHSDVVIETLERGHEIGSHTWNHSKLTTLSSNQILDQLSLTETAIKDVTGQNPTVFRPPYGAKNKHVVSLIDLPVVMWTIDTLDWKYRDANSLLPMVEGNMHNNAIILMHDIHQSTADGLESVLQHLQDEGYEFVTVSEILQYQ